MGKKMKDGIWNGIFGQTGIFGHGQQSINGQKR
jgi:hypothetical protein